MATKLKNKIWLGLFSFFISISFISIYTLITLGPSVIYKDYFRTPEFQQDVHTFASLLYLSDMNSKTEQELMWNITITEQEIEEYRYRHGSLEEQIHAIEQQYEQRIQSVKPYTDNKDSIDQIIAEKDEKITDITNNFISDNYIYEKISNEKEQKIKEFKHMLDTYLDDFQYYFTHNRTGEVYTNIPMATDEKLDYVLSRNNMTYITNYTIYTDEPNNYINNYDGIIQENSLNGWYEGQIAIPNNLPAASPTLKAQVDYEKEQKTVWLFSFFGLITSIAAYAMRKQIKHQPKKDRHFYERVPIDLKLFIFSIINGCAVWLLIITAQQLPYITENQHNIHHLETVIMIGVSSLLIGLAISQGQSLFNSIRHRNQLKHLSRQALLVKVFQRGKHIFHTAFHNRKLGTQIFLTLSFTFLLGLSAIFLYTNQTTRFIYVISLIIIGSLMIIFAIKKISYFNQITKKAKNLADGELEDDLPVRDKSPLANLSQHMNIVKDELAYSRSERAKSERLKTELITNISHDLRTPLTSIITYADLLKHEGNSKKTERHYLEIINQKSNVLKGLIDDLFEVSKMTSGNVTLNLARVDLIQLLQQALGEYDEEIRASHLQFRLSKPKTPLFAQVDGQKMWRVFDNLISNILKYSLENSRVYISLAKLNNNQEILITFSNVSKHELDPNSEELVERFKRGDRSRHTDGVGLGLAIAQSIIALHDGTLDIETDGDLFKVLIRLNLTE